MMMGPSSHMGRPPLQSRGFGMRGPRAEAMNIGEQKGGFLAKLFQRGTPQATGTMAGFSRANPASGSILEGVKNPQTIQSFLNNTQQVLKTAQQIGPIVQQYGPLVKNLPTMWKLYKGFKQNQNEQQTTTKANNEQASSEKNRPTESSTESSSFEQFEQEKLKSNSAPQGKSIPKLYI